MKIKSESYPRINYILSYTVYQIFDLMTKTKFQEQIHRSNRPLENLN